MNKIKKHSYKELEEKCIERDYELISEENEYVNCGSKMRYICKKHTNNGEQITTLGRLLEGKGCYFCGREKTENAHKIQLDYNEHKKLCESKGFIYINSMRKNGKIVIEFICKKHIELGHQYMEINNMKRDIKGCQYCSGKNLPKSYVFKKAEEINPNIKVLDEYVNLTTRMNCFCEKHNVKTYKTMQEILKGSGCYYCGLEKLSENSFLSKDEFQNRVSINNPNLIVIKYNGMSECSTFQCLKCSYIFNSNSSYASNNHKLCPNCENYYKGEKSIGDFLDNNFINYEFQKRFIDCKDIKTLPFDFYLPKYNMCIEYDGLQHYKQRDGWSDLSIVQKHDAIKNKYCEDNNIKLIRIPYWEYNNIDYILKQEININ